MSVVPVIMTIVGYIFVNVIIPWNLFGMLVEGFIFVCIFVVFTWVFSMNQYEKSIFIGLFKNLNIIGQLKSLKRGER